MDSSSELFDFMASMTDDERSGFVESSAVGRIVVAGVVGSAVVCCSLMKLFIYGHLAKQKMSERPISILVLVDQVLDHLAMTVLAINLLAQVMANQSFPQAIKSLTHLEMNDRSFCIGYSHLRYALISYTSIGSFGIALYRVLYIKATNWVNKIKSDRLLMLILFSGLGCTLTLSQMSGAGHVTNSTSFNTCMGYSNRFEEGYLIYNSLDVITESPGMKIYPFIMIIFQLLELICYINLYSYVHNHDKTMANEKIISQDAYKARFKTQSVSLFAQFLGFLVELTYNILHFLVKTLGRKFLLWVVQDYNNFFRLSEYCFITAVTIFATPNMRTAFLAMVRKT